MANAKASAFTTRTNCNPTDLFPFVRQGSPNTNNNIAFSNLLAQIRGGTYDVKEYGALGDGKVLTDLTTTNGSPTVSSLSYTFTSADIGKLFTIVGAATGSKTLNTTISSISGGNAVLSSNAGVTLAHVGVGTFGTDDTSSIQSAITAASNAGGGVVFIPASIYIFSNLVWYSKVSMIGLGWGHSILKYITVADMSAAAIRGSVASAMTPYVDCIFSDFEIDCIAATHSGNSATGNKAIYLQYMTRPVFQRLYLHDTPASTLGVDFLQDAVIADCIVSGGGNGTPTHGGACIGIGIGGLSNETYTLTGNTVIGGFSFGIFFETQTGTVITSQNASATVAGNVVYLTSGTKIGIGDCGLTNFVCTGNKVYCGAGPSQGTGISVQAGTLAGQAGIKGIINGNAVFGALTAGIAINYGGTGADPGVFCGYQISDNVCDTCTSGVVVTTGPSLSLNTLTVTGNQIYNSTSAGMVFTGAGGINDLILRGNTACNNATTTAAAKNKCGIAIQSAVTRLRMSDNACFENSGAGKQLYGMIIDTVAVTGAFVNDNDFGNNATGAINLTNGATIAGSITNNKGYNPLGLIAVTPGASPWTYTAGNTPEVLYLLGGTVSAVVKNSITLASALSATQSLPVILAPGESVTVTYTVAPTANTDQQ